MTIEAVSWFGVCSCVWWDGNEYRRDRFYRGALKPVS